MVTGSQVTEKLPKPHMQFWSKRLVAKEEHLVIDQSTIKSIHSGLSRLIIPTKRRH